MSEVSKPRKNATNTQITKDDRIEHALLKNELIYKLFNSGLYVKEILSILVWYCSCNAGRNAMAQLCSCGDADILKQNI